MGAQRYWIQQGHIQTVTSTWEGLSPEAEDHRLRAGDVRLTTGSLGTEIKWHVNTPCMTSLFRTMQWLTSVRVPVFLRFFAIGWFEEVYADTASAIARLEQLLARGDRYFTGRVFIKEAEADKKLLPDVLRAALEGQPVPPEYVVDCSYDEGSHMFRVNRIGPKSAIGRVWGTYTTSHPCQSDGPYGDPVNASYGDVMRSGRPRYDHVIAALRLPDNAIHWVPYQRVVFPKKDDKGGPGVEVISQIARVDIQVL